MAGKLGRTLTLIVLINLGIWVSQTASRTLHEPSVDAKHEQWVTVYGKTYRDDAEKELRLRIFSKNLELESFNSAGNKPYKLGINEFADQTDQEVKASRNGYKRKRPSLGFGLFRYENVSVVPSSVDWRKKGAVTSCQKSRTMRMLLGILRYSSNIRDTPDQTGQLEALSEQELVDCNTKTADQGCAGGLMDDAFQFIIKNGRTSEANYGRCTVQHKEASNSPAKIGGFEDVPSNNEQALLKAVAFQPVSVAIDASGAGFQVYSSGVFSGPCGTDLDQGVTIVGYGTTVNGVDYWLVKNSWGTQWGEDGYILMGRNIDANEGICGIAMEASYPTVWVYI